MAEEKVEELSLPVVSDLVGNDNTGYQLHVKNYDATKAKLEAILADYPVFIINNDEDKKSAKNKRAALNGLLDTVKRTRIDGVKGLVGPLEEEVKSLEKMIDERQKAFGDAVKDYEAAQLQMSAVEGVVIPTKSKAKVITLTIKTYDPKVAQKISDLAVKNNCEVSVK